MFSILLAEDEPAAARYLTRLISETAPDFSVTRTAGDGAAALDMIAEQVPDLVITDVRMLLMDGLELVSRLNTLYPDLPVIIVSGYQKFDYVRKALATGVVDYLIKPVNAGQLSDLFSHVRKIVASRRQQAVLAYLRRLMCVDCGAVKREGAGPRDSSVNLDVSVNLDASEGEFGAETSFHIALYRSGGLVSRFHPEVTDARGEYTGEGCFKVPGRDGLEWACFAPAEQIGLRDFYHAAAAEMDKFDDPTKTLICSAAPAAGQELIDRLQELMKSLDRLILPGNRRTHIGVDVPMPEEHWDPVSADSIDFCVRENRWDELQEVFYAIARRWEKIQLPLIAAEGFLRNYLMNLKQLLPTSLNLSELEYAVDAVLSEADSYHDFAAAASRLVVRLCSPGGGDRRPSEFPVIVRELNEWIHSHYAEPLTLESVSRRFHISSSYLSKLLRRHLGVSFGEALTSARIGAAKRLIEDVPDMLLKDVAARTGYQDPFYFSKVFKAKVGVPPSDYHGEKG
jgi:two-component system, response regulator YesN